MKKKKNTKCQKYIYNVEEKYATCASHNTTVSKRHLGIFDSVELPMVLDLPRWHKSNLEGTTI